MGAWNYSVPVPESEGRLDIVLAIFLEYSPSSFFALSLGLEVPVLAVPGHLRAKFLPL